MKNSAKWISLDKPKVNMSVLLCKPRRVFGDKGIDPAMIKFFGRIGTIIKVDSDERDSVGCRLVWVSVEIMDDEGKKILETVPWRLASVKIQRRIGH